MRESIWCRLRDVDKALISKHWQSIGAPVAPLLNKFGLAIDLRPLPEDLAGYLQYDPANGAPSRFTVVVNKRHPRTRRAFTAAHELGHYLLHRREDVFMSGATTNRGFGYDTFYTDDDQKEEQEANAFAAGLLMPIEAIETAVLKENLKPKDIAARFRVSEQAARLRCEDVWRRRM